MLHEQISKYDFAERYARRTLGDDLPASQFSRLHSLARTLSRLELQAVIDSWVLKPEPQLKPESKQQSVRDSEQWKPCKHFGGSRECPTCLKQNTEAGVRLAGALAIANTMYEKHRRFVLDRIYGECLPFTVGRAYSEAGDLEQKVWQNVASRIAKYDNHDQPLAWLKSLVHSTVVNHFRDAFRQKRDVRKTDQFDPAKHDAASIFDGRTAVPVKPENDPRKVLFNQADIPFFKK